MRKQHALLRHAAEDTEDISSLANGAPADHAVLLPQTKQLICEEVACQLSFVTRIPESATSLDPLL